MIRTGIRTAHLLAMAAACAMLYTNIATHGALAYEMKDEEPSPLELKKTLDEIGTTFEAFKKKNDERIADLEKKGSADYVTRDELEKINTDLSEALDAKKRLEELETKMARPGAGGGGSGDEERPSEEMVEHKTAFLALLRDPNDHEAQAACQAAEKKYVASLSPEERKAVDTLTGPPGGFAVPQVISRRIERNLAESRSLRNLVDVQSAGSPQYKILVDVRGATYGWVGETDPRPETNTPQLAEVDPTFGTIYAYPKTTEDSLDDMFFNVENWVINSAIEGFEQGEENAIIAGDGTKKPTGLLTLPTTLQKDGVRPFGTLQHYASGAAAALTDADPLLDMIYGIKKGYRRNARWLANKLTYGAVRKLKDGDGDYIWQPGLQAGQPNRLLNYTADESEEMPDIAANALPLAFGDFKAAYALVPLHGIRITRDPITEPGYMKWHIRRRMGGNHKKTEAVKLLKIET